MYRVGRGRLSLLLSSVFPWGEALYHWEGGRPVGGMDPQKHSIGFLRGASLVTGTGSLWDFGWGMGEADGADQCLCSPLS